MRGGKRRERVVSMSMISERILHNSMESLTFHRGQAQIRKKILHNSTESWTVHTWSFVKMYKILK